jgi:hypothetical protein
MPRLDHAQVGQLRHTLVRPRATQGHTREWRRGPTATVGVVVIGALLLQPPRSRRTPPLNLHLERRGDVHDVPRGVVMLNEIACPCRPRGVDMTAVPGTSFNFGFSSGTFSGARSRQSPRRVVADVFDGETRGLGITSIQSDTSRTEISYNKV